jgi:hypothetical protein
MPVFRAEHKGLSHSEALAEAYASAPVEDVILETLEFRHPLFRDAAGAPYAVRVVNDHDPLTAGLEANAPLNPGATVQFEPMSFQLAKPSETESASSPEMDILMGNAMQVLHDYVELAQGSRDPVEVTWRPYLARDLSAPHVNPVLTLFVREVHCDLLQLTIRVGFGDIVNKRFPSRGYTGKSFPWLTLR